MTRRRAFTIVELLVVVSVIAVLISVLLPAIGKAREQARLTTSQTNLRQLGIGARNYASEWNGRQFTVVPDSWGRYGNNYAAAGENYLAAGGSPRDLFVHQGPGVCPDGGTIWVTTGDGSGWILEPIHMPGGFGWFRYSNALPIRYYVARRRYDAVFYAPKDRVVLNAIEEHDCADDPAEVCLQDWCTTGQPFFPCLPSYVYSAAALYSPDVFRRSVLGGFQDPYTLDAGFRAPAMSMAKYPSLKTHILEHHWLQNARSTTNPAMIPWNTEYDGEPYYFNHSWESVPATLFYDGHVGPLGVREAEAADSRMQVQSGDGLWSRDTPFGSAGYFSDIAYDYAQTSFHILTTEGIRGRDKIAK